MRCWVHLLTAFVLVGLNPSPGWAAMALDSAQCKAFLSKASFMQEIQLHLHWARERAARNSLPCSSRCHRQPRPSQSVQVPVLELIIARDQSEHTEKPTQRVQTHVIDCDSD